MKTFSLVLLAFVTLACMSDHARAQPEPGDLKLDPWTIRICNRPGCVGDGGVLAGKADSTDGVLTSPTVRTGLGATALALGETVTGPHKPGTDPTALLSSGPITINRATNGEEHRAGGLEVALNMPGDTGCSNGGFYENPLSRGLYGSRDLVAGCFNIAQPVPIAAGVAAAFIDDPTNVTAQTTAASPTYQPVATGQKAKGTKVVFEIPLSPAQVSQLSPGMVVETNNFSTGAITAWDPAGTWITVDVWVLIASNPVLTGYSPASYGGTSLTINTVSQIYGANINMVVPSNGYRQGGHSASALGIELAIDNEGQAVTRDEFGEFNDSPRVWGMNVGAGGGAGQGSAGYVTLGAWDKAYEVLSQTGYAGFLYSASAGTPGEAAFVSQQNFGTAFEVKPQVRGGTKTFLVDSGTGSTTRGLIGTRQAVHAVLSGPLSLSGTTPYPMTLSGNPSAGLGNDPVSFAANGIYSLDGTVGCSDGANGLQVHVSGMWAAGPNPAGASNKAFQSSALSSFGAVSGWQIGSSTDNVGWGPILYFQGAANVTCAADINVMRVN